MNRVPGETGTLVPGETGTRYPEKPGPGYPEKPEPGYQVAGWQPSGTAGAGRGE